MLDALARASNVRAVGFALFVTLFLVVPLQADIHPVPLDKNADTAKCLECHSSDDNREFGGSGPNGPHGSIYPHILERNYIISQAATPGGPVSNTMPTPDLSSQGPYAMCAKCHNLSIVVSSASWPQHVNHVSQDGLSCSTCHTAHGMGAVNGNISGNSLINFDLGVVAQNQTTPISYNSATNTCTLVCHGAIHNSDGTVTGTAAAASAIRKR